MCTYLSTNSYYTPNQGHLPGIKVTNAVCISDPGMFPVLLLHSDIYDVIDDVPTCDGATGSLALLSLRDPFISYYVHSVSSQRCYS